MKFAIAQQRGFSLVELLVAMAIASVLGVAGVALFATSNWTYKVNEDVSEAQQNVRVAMEWLAKDIRTAGFGLEDPPTELDFGNGGVFTAPITVTNSSTDYDTITILGIGYEAGTLQKGAATDCNDNTHSKICMDSVDDFFTSGFVTSRKYISLNGTTFIELSTTQSGQADNKLTLGSPSTLDRNYPDDTPVFIIQAVQYTIATNLTGCSSTNPCLASADYTMLRGGSTPGARQVVVDSIEDIQFAFGIDVSPRDSKIDDYNGDGSFTTADFVDDPADDTSIVAVRANVVAKTRNIDMKGGQFSKICQEDRSTDTGCTNAATDGYRRRLLTKVIKLRNPRSGGS